MIAIDKTFVRMFSPKEQLVMIRLLVEADDSGMVAINEQLLSDSTDIPLNQIGIIISKLLKDCILTNKENIFSISNFKTYWIKPKVQRKKKDVVVSAKPLKERMHDFGMSLTPYLVENGGKYPKEMIRAFYDYWTEPNQSNTKMKWELQKTWSTAGRLATWASRDRNFSSNNNYKTRDEQRANELQRRQADAAGIIARLAAEEDSDSQ